MISQHYYWKGMKEQIARACTRCVTCNLTKKKTIKLGKLPPKPKPETIPWHTVCIDLVGPYKVGHGENAQKLHCLSMIDPATGWHEIATIPTKHAHEIANVFEIKWLTR